MKHCKIAIIIPALNEAPSIAGVIRSIPKEFLGQVIVVDGGSLDGTVEIARSLGAIVIQNQVKTYDHACFAGAYAASADILVFLHAGGDDDATALPRLVAPVISGAADLVMGSRVLPDNRGDHNLLWHQYMGTKGFIWLINILFQTHFSDIGPFRAISMAAYKILAMKPVGFSWTTQMLIKSLKLNLKVQEIPVKSSRRIGKSKISGSLLFSFLALKDMLWSFTYLLQ